MVFDEFLVALHLLRAEFNANGRTEIKIGQEKEQDSGWRGRETFRLL